MPRSSRFMNVGQAASYLGVSAASLRNWSNRGLVPVYRTPGGQRRYDASDLDDFMHSMREPVEGGKSSTDDESPAGERQPISTRG
ncbi:MAG TPA: helix-turn-helix domain-containing protein [Solirubrobacterales bacterium]|nr:helix-turn-helix domain-containing protein [Solirubrobacterales bacterium]